MSQPITFTGGHYSTNTKLRGSDETEGFGGVMEMDSKQPMVIDNPPLRCLTGNKKCFENTANAGAQSTPQITKRVATTLEEWDD